MSIICLVRRLVVGRSVGLTRFRIFSNFHILYLPCVNTITITSDPSKVAGIWPDGSLTNILANKKPPRRVQSTN